MRIVYWYREMVIVYRSLYGIDNVFLYSGEFVVSSYSYGI